jgi:hypothetical protein
MREEVILLTTKLDKFTESLFQSWLVSKLKRCKPSPNQKKIKVLQLLQFLKYFLSLARVPLSRR